MKKLIVILMVLSFNVFAERIDVGLPAIDDVRTVCIKGYLFVIYKGYNKGGIVQIYKQVEGSYGIRPPQPMKCEVEK